MLGLRFDDVSRDPALAVRAVGARPLRDPLVSLGFRTVGYVRTRAARPERVPEVVALADGLGAEAARLLREGQVTEVLQAPDRRCFAEPHYALGARWIRFVSVLEDGSIVETHTVPAEEARVDPEADLDGLVGALAWVGPLRWATHPLGGLRAEAVPGSAVATWGRHCQRLDEIELEERVAALDHRRLDLFREGAERVAEVRGSFARVALRSFWITWGALATVGGWGAVWALGRSVQALALVALWLAMLAVAQRPALLAWPEAIGAPLARWLPRRVRARLPRKAGPTEVG